MSNLMWGLAIIAVGLILAALTTAYRANRGPFQAWRMAHGVHVLYTLAFMAALGFVGFFAIYHPVGTLITAAIVVMILLVTMNWLVVGRHLLAYSLRTLVAVVLVGAVIWVARIAGSILPGVLLFWAIAIAIVIAIVVFWGAFVALPITYWRTVLIVFVGLILLGAFVRAIPPIRSAAQNFWAWINEDTAPAATVTTSGSTVTVVPPVQGPSSPVTPAPSKAGGSSGRRATGQSASRSTGSSAATTVVTSEALIVRHASNGMPMFRSMEDCEDYYLAIGLDYRNQGRCSADKIGK